MILTARNCARRQDNVDTTNTYKVKAPNIECIYFLKEHSSDISKTWQTHIYLAEINQASSLLVLIFVFVGDQ